MSEKIPLKEVLIAVDLKAKNLWDDIDDEQRKALKSELWILNRYVSNVKSSNVDAQKHFVFMVNECFNKHWFTLQKHPKLLWQLLCLCSLDGEKTFFHEWIGHSKKKTSGKREALLREIYPNMKDDDLETLLEINSDVDFRDIAREMGWAEKDVKNL
jgi:hypothetical protein